MTTATKHKAIHKLLDEFLSQRNKATDGYASFSKVEEDKLYELLDAICEAKFEADADGAYPLEYVIVNRNNSERLHFLPQPYFHKIKSFEDFDSVLLTATTNAGIANSRLSEIVLSIRDKAKSES